MSKPPTAKINITQINAALKVVSVTTAQLKALGFEGEKSADYGKVFTPNGGWYCWPESDLLKIKAAIRERLQ